MRLILLSGGSGYRLWPLTDAQNPKQYLDLLSAPNGQKRSMAQRVWQQVEHTGLAPGAVVCAGREQRAYLAEQIPQAAVVEEPSGRDTFPAVALSCAYLMDVEGAGPDEAVVVIPIDCYADEAYFEALKRLPEALDASGADVVLMGKRPTAPETKYGYILPGTVGADGCLRVAGFREKPDEEDAGVLIASGALWNMGVFCLRLGYLKNILAASGAPTDYKGLYRAYETLPRISFDRRVLEKSCNLAAVPFDGLWRDIGTWNELIDVLPPAPENYVRHKSCTDTFILNHLDIPVIAIGVKNLIVVASDNGILIADSGYASAIKEIIPEMEAHEKHGT